MNGRTHVIYGFIISFIVFGVLAYLTITRGFDFGGFFGIPAFLTFFGGTVLGTLFSDYDILIAPENKRMALHRYTLSHSAIFPLLATTSYAFTNDVTARIFLLFICVGMSTHLAFDLFISNMEGYTFIDRWAKRIYQFARGNVGGTFKGPGAKWANKHERAYLIIHALICIACAYILFWGIYNGIDIDIWWNW